MTEQEARDFLTALGDEIELWRKRRKLSRAELGDMVGLSETTIGRIERGSADTALPTSDAWRIASHLGISFSDLIRRAEEMTTIDAEPELSEGADTSMPEAALEGEEEPGAPQEG